MNDFEHFDGDSGDRSSIEERLLAFLALYNTNRRRMILLAKTLLPGEDVEDVLQEASLALWRKFPAFEPGSDFGAWASQMIRIEVRRLYKKRYREKRFYDEELTDAVFDFVTRKDDDEIESRYEALADCSKKLPKKMKDLVYARYFKKQGVEEIARRAGQSAAAVYQQLCRIRAALRRCVTEKTNQ